MSKGQFSLVPKIILVVVVSLVLLLFSTGLFDVMKSMSSTSACKASAIANAAGNVASVGGDVIKLDCPTKYIKISENKNSKSDDSEDDVINAYVDNPLTSGELKRLAKFDYFQVQNDNYYDRSSNIPEKDLYTFRLNEIVGKEMRGCWDNLGNGKLNLFSSWFDYFGTENKDACKNCNEAATKNWLSTHLPTKIGAPTVCVICSRIEIDDDLYTKMKSELDVPVSTTDYKDKSNSLIYWLTHNPVPRTSISYYEYLLDDLNNDIFGPENRNFQYSDESFAVVYAVTNPHVLDNVFSNTDYTSVLGGVVGGLILGGKGALLGYLISGGGEGIVQGISDSATGKNSITSLYIVPYTKEGLEEYCTVLAN